MYRWIVTLPNANAFHGTCATVEQAAKGAAEFITAYREVTPLKQADGIWTASIMITHLVEG